MPSCYISGREGGLQCLQENKTVDIEEAKQCGYRKLSNGQSDLAGGKQSQMARGTMSATGLLFFFFSRASECERGRKKGKAERVYSCSLLSKGGIKKGGMWYLKGSTCDPSVPTCSAPCFDFSSRGKQVWASCWTSRVSTGLACEVQRKQSEISLILFFSHPLVIRDR